MRTCVLYIASRRGQYCEDAVTSRNSVKAHNPKLPCILATENASGLSGWDRTLQMSPLRYPDMWYLDSTRWTNEAFNLLYDDYDAIILLDSDTYITANLDEVFELATRFDLCAVHEFNRHTCNTVKPIPNSFPEVNIGVILVQTNEHVRNLFKDWLELYEAHPDIFLNNDQGPLREAMWINKLLNMYIMTEEFNCRWGFGVTVVSNVRILHSRAAGPAPYTNERAAREINAVGGRRLFRPAEGSKPAIWWRPVKGEEEYRG